MQPSSQLESSPPSYHPGPGVVVVVIVVVVVMVVVVVDVAEISHATTSFNAPDNQPLVVKFPYSWISQLPSPGVNSTGSVLQTDAVGIAGYTIVKWAVLTSSLEHASISACWM